MITRTKIDIFLAAEKRAVAPMNWQEKLSRRDPQWWEFVSAIEIDGVVAEDVLIRALWRPGMGAAGDKYNCGLFYWGARIYAVDFDPDGLHFNNVGKGRELYRKRIGPGTHEHTWSEDGYGYAEPIPNFPAFAALFDYFCKKSNLTVVSGFRPPPSIQIGFTFK